MRRGGSSLQIRWLVLGFALGALSTTAQTPPPPPEPQVPASGPVSAEPGEAPPVLVWPTPVASKEPGLSAEPQIPDLSASAGTGSKPGSAARKKKLAEGKPIFIVAPIPSRSPALGFGLTLVAGALFRPNRADKVSPLSMVGIAAFGADNHSRGVAVGGRLYLKEDKYRLTAALGDAEIYFDYYGAGAASGTGSTPYPLKITGRGGTGEFLWRIAPKWYIGPSLAYMPMKTALDVETPEALKALGIEELALKSTVASLGVHLQRDQRNDTIDPRKGSLFDVKVKANRKMWGSTFDYQIADASYKFFWSPRERQTLALWGQARMAGGRVPFYALSSYDLRGYTAGHHQDRAMVIGQAEYRLRLSKRWGAVAFAGTGAVAPDFSSFGKSEWLPGAGLGLRFALSKKSRMNLRLDYAWGRDGNRAVYFAVGEAF